MKGIILWVLLPDIFFLQYSFVFEICPEFDPGSEFVANGVLLAAPGIGVLLTGVAHLGAFQSNVPMLGFLRLRRAPPLRPRRRALPHRQRRQVRRRGEGKDLAAATARPPGRQRSRTYTRARSATVSGSRGTLNYWKAPPTLLPPPLLPGVRPPRPCGLAQYFFDENAILIEDDTLWPWRPCVRALSLFP